MLRAIKYELNPTKAQKTLIRQSCGCCRKVYNVMLDRKISAYKEDGTSLSKYELINQLAELKKELKNVDELRFIFTSPTFIKEKAKREKREFYIPRQEREKNLFGSEFEVKLRNEMTQKAIAKECAEWIRKKAVFKSNVTNENMMGFINVDDKNYMPLSGFTTVDLGCERGVSQS